MNRMDAAWLGGMILLLILALTGPAAAQERMHKLCHGLPQALEIRFHALDGRKPKCLPQARPLKGGDACGPDWPTSETARQATPGGSVHHQQ